MARYQKFQMGFHLWHVPQFIFDIDELIHNIDYLTHQQVKYIAEDLEIRGRSKMNTRELREAVTEYLSRIDGVRNQTELFNNNPARAHLLNINRVWTVNELRQEWDTIKQYANFTQSFTYNIMKG